jgi:hypothetical protein
MARGNIDKRCATYPANICPIHCGGATSHSRHRTTILHNESVYSKRFFVAIDPRPRDPAQTRLRVTVLERRSNEKEN